MRRNGLLLPFAALLLALAIAGALALDFRSRWEAERARLETVGPASLDGRIDQGEYANSYTDDATGIVLYWTVSGEELFLGLRCPNRGWVAVGLGGEGPMMKGADILIAYVDAEGVHAQDSYGNDTMTHTADTDLGGSDDLLEVAGQEIEGSTVIEMRRALETGDPFDTPITAGELRVLLAHAESDDFTTYHTGRSTATLRLREASAP